MMWNYRMVDCSESENGGEPWIMLCEVFYDDDGKPMGYSAPCVGSETVEGMKELLDMHAHALKHPVLKPEDFTDYNKRTTMNQAKKVTVVVEFQFNGVVETDALMDDVFGPRGMAVLMQETGATCVTALDANETK